MEETTYALQESYTVTIAADGTATVTNVGPIKNGERWEITNTSVNTTVGCNFQSFRGDPNSTGIGQIDFTTKGTGDSSDTVIKLQSGERISFRWSNGTVGGIGVVTISGNRFVRGRRAY